MYLLSKINFFHFIYSCDLINLKNHVSFLFRMGTFQMIEGQLPERFSFFRVASLLGLEDTDKESIKALRNTMAQFCKEGYLERISHNVYQKKKKESK